MKESRKGNSTRFGVVGLMVVVLLLTGCFNTHDLFSKGNLETSDSKKAAKEAGVSFDNNSSSISMKEKAYSEVTKFMVTKMCAVEGVTSCKIPDYKSDYVTTISSTEYKVNSTVTLYGDYSTERYRYKVVFEINSNDYSFDIQYFEVE